LSAAPADLPRPLLSDSGNWKSTVPAAGIRAKGESQGVHAVQTCVRLSASCILHVSILDQSGASFHLSCVNHLVVIPSTRCQSCLAEPAPALVPL